MPIAAIRPNGQSGVDVFYIHADHLGTPRKISRPSDNQVLWTWESEAFGHTPPNENPTGQGVFVYNLRFPGQYYDTETGLHYNYFRDYDAGTGRYVQSDPIGLSGGINTYGYVNGNPVNFSDPLGLFLINPITVGAVEGLINTVGGLIILNAAMESYSGPDNIPDYFKEATNDENFGQCTPDGEDPCKNKFLRLKHLWLGIRDKANAGLSKNELRLLAEAYNKEREQFMEKCPNYGEPPKMNIFNPFD